jgi:uncharacterized membrane protein HdeD (DUF308 family)
VRFSGGAEPATSTCPDGFRRARPRTNVGAMNATREADEQLRAQIRRVTWRWGMLAAVAALVVGAIGLIFPQQTVRAIGLLLGVYLVVAGISRVSSAISDNEVARGRRWSVGLLGALVVVAGVVCLNNPGGTLLALEIVASIGLLIDGIASIAFALVVLRSGEQRVPALLAGVVLILVAVIILAMPQATLAAFVLVSAWALTTLGILALGALIRLRPGRNS